MALAVVFGAALPAHAAALTNVAWSVSKPHPSSTAVRYSWSFTTTTTNTIKYITFTVPAATPAAALSVVDYYGVSVGTAVLAGTTVTYTVTTPVAVAAGVNVLISIDGFTNTGTAGSYASTVTTQTTAPATIDNGNSNTVAINTNTTAATVVVARTTSFSNNTTGFTMLMDPSLPALSDTSYPVQLGVATNAASGYTLAVNVNRQLTGTSGSTFAAVSAGKATGVATGAFTAGKFGYMASAVAGGGGTVQGAGLLAGNYVGYTVPGETIFSSAGPTTGDTVTITNRAMIGYQQAADTYTATITYLVSPTY